MFNLDFNNSHTVIDDYDRDDVIKDQLFPVVETQFGTGDILMQRISTTRNDNNIFGLEFIKSNHKLQPGEYLSKDVVQPTKYDVYTRLVFSDVRSLDVVIEELQKIRDEYYPK